MELDLDRSLELDRLSSDVARGLLGFGWISRRRQVGDLITVEFGMGCDEAPKGEFAGKIERVADRDLWITRDLARRWQGHWT